MKFTGHRGPISEGRLSYSDTIAHSSNFRTHTRRSGHIGLRHCTGATSGDLPAAHQHATHSTRGPHARPIWSLGAGRERGKHFCRPSGPSGGRSWRHAASVVRRCRGGWLHRERGLFGEEKSSFGSKDMMIEERRRPGSARAGRYQEVRGGEGGERDGMDTPWHSCRSKYIMAHRQRC